jgi:hypothetical protein
MEQVLHSRMVLIVPYSDVLELSLIRRHHLDQWLDKEQIPLSFTVCTEFFIFIRAPRCSFLCSISLLCNIHHCDEHCWWRSHKSLPHDARLNFHCDPLSITTWPWIQHQCYIAPSCDNIKKLDRESLFFVPSFFFQFGTLDAFSKLIQL